MCYFERLNEKIKDRNIAYDNTFVLMSNDKPPKAKMYRSAK